MVNQQAEAMLLQLRRHFGEPVLPMSRYCSALETWGQCIAERVGRLEKELLPNLHDWDKSDQKNWKRTKEAEAQRDEYDAVKIRAGLLDLFPGIHSLKGKLSDETLSEISKFALVSSGPFSSRADKLRDLHSFETISREFRIGHRW
jgi:hypothetical protein